MSKASGGDGEVLPGGEISVGEGETQQGDQQGEREAQSEGLTIIDFDFDEAWSRLLGWIDKYVDDSRERSDAAFLQLVKQCAAFREDRVLWEVPSIKSAQARVHMTMYDFLDAVEFKRNLEGLLHGHRDLLRKGVKERVMKLWEEETNNAD